MKKVFSAFCAAVLAFGASALPFGEIADTVIVASASFEYEGFVCEELVSGEVRIEGCTGDGIAITVPSEINGKNVKEIASGAFKDNGDITSLYVEGGVTILPQAFSGCVGLESVVIGEGCDVWGSAFENCTSLKSVAVMKDTTIGMFAFEGCDNVEKFFCYKDSPADNYWFSNGLAPTYFDDGDIDFEGVYDVFEFKAMDGWSLLDESGEQIVVCITKYVGGDTHLNVVVPETIMGFPVYRIDEFAFFDCNSIQSVKLPETVKVIDAAAFMKCSNLKNISIENVEDIGAQAFDSTAIGKAVLNEKLEGIAAAAFFDCGLTEITLPKDITVIGFDAFAANPIDKIAIPDKVWYIATRAFYNTKIRDVTIPASVTEIEETAFGYGTVDLYDEEGNYTGWEEVKYDDMIIRGYDGTAAEKYAKDNGFEFVSLGPGKKKGALNGNGKIDASDLLQVKSHIKKVKPLEGDDFDIADVDGNGAINAADLLKMKAHMKGVTLIWE